MPNIDWLAEAQKKFNDSITVGMVAHHQHPVAIQIEKIKECTSNHPQHLFKVHGSFGTVGVFASHWRASSNIEASFEWKYPFTEGMVVSSALELGPTVYFLHRFPMQQWTLGCTAANTRCVKLRTGVGIRLDQITKVSPELIVDFHKPATYTKEIPWPFDYDIALARDWAISSNRLFYKHFQIGDVTACRKVRMYDPRYSIFQEQLNMFGLSLCQQ